MAYVKIVFGLLVWGALLFFFGGDWLNIRREEACASEIEKRSPNLKVVEERCLQTAELYMENEHYGSAAWFYLLGGSYQKNIDEVEAKIDNDFYMNVGHSYVLSGEYDKARVIYENYPWKSSESYATADSDMQHDYEILPRLYVDKRENLAKGLSIWNEIYAPLKEISKAYSAYGVSRENDEDAKRTIPLLLSYLEKARPFQSKEEIDYLRYHTELAQLYSADGKEKRAIAVYKDIASGLEGNRTEEENYVDILLEIAKLYGEVDRGEQLNYYQKSLAFVSESNNSALPTKEVHYDYIGDTYFEMDKLKRASAYYHKALALREEMNPKKYDLLVLSHKNLAKIELKSDDHDAYREDFERAIALHKEEINATKDEDTITEALESIGGLYLSLTDTYRDLNQSGVAEALDRDHMAYLQKNHKERLSLLFDVYSSASGKFENSLESFNLLSQGIAYKEQELERDSWMTQPDEHEKLFYELESLKSYANDIDSDENSTLQQRYRDELERFRLFEESVFDGDHLILAKTYRLLSTSLIDINSTLGYAQKTIEEMELAIEETDEDNRKGYRETMDEDTVNLWQMTAMYEDEKQLPSHFKKSSELIEAYLTSKREKFNGNPTIMAKSYQVVGDFYVGDKLVDQAIIDYKQAFSLFTEANLRNEENRELYYESIRRIFGMAKDESLMDASKGLELIMGLLSSHKKEFERDNVLLSEFQITLSQLYAKKSDVQMVKECQAKALQLLYDEVSDRNSSEHVFELDNVLSEVVSYAENRGEKQEVIVELNRYLQFIKETFPKDKNQIAEAYNRVAFEYDTLKDSEHRLLYREKAFNSLRDALNDEDGYENHFDDFLRYSYYLSLAYQEEKRAEKIKEHIAYLKDFIVKNSLKDEYRVGLLGSIANSYLMLNDYKKSINYKSLSRMRKFLNCDDISYEYDIYLDREKYLGLSKACNTLP